MKKRSKVKKKKQKKICQMPSWFQGTSIKAQQVLQMLVRKSRYCCRFCVCYGLNYYKKWFYSIGFVSDSYRFVNKKIDKPWLLVVFVKVSYLSYPWDGFLFYEMRFSIFSICVYVSVQYILILTKVKWSIVCIGVSTQPQNYHPPLFHQASS